MKIKRKKFSDDEKLEILNKSFNKCAHCGKKLTLATMTVEHMYPVDKGGDNSDYNLVALCENCNAKKNNFVYDISYFPFLNSKLEINYEKELLTNIYKRIDDSHILGKSNSVITVIDTSQAELLRKCKKRNIRALKLISKKYELRELMPGDIDENVNKLVGSSFIIPATGEDAESNKYALINIAEEATIYGIYYANELRAVFGYININKLDIKDTKFLKELDKLNFDNTYVEIIRAYKYKDSFIVSKITEKIVEFMTFTNNLVLLTHTNEINTIGNCLRGMPSAVFNLPVNIDYMRGAYFEITLFDRNYNNLDEQVKSKREYFEINKEEQEYGKN